MKGVITAARIIGPAPSRNAVIDERDIEIDVLFEDGTQARGVLVSKFEFSTASLERYVALLNAGDVPVNG